MPTPDLNEAAAQMGRKGGKKKVPKGFAKMTDEEKHRVQSMGGKARWKKKRGKASSTPSKRKTGST